MSPFRKCQVKWITVYRIGIYRLSYLVAMSKAAFLWEKKFRKSMTWINIYKPIYCQVWSWDDFKIGRQLTNFRTRVAGEQLFDSAINDFRVIVFWTTKVRFLSNGWLPSNVRLVTSVVCIGHVTWLAQQVATMATGQPRLWFNHVIWHRQTDRQFTVSQTTCNVRSLPTTAIIISWTNGWDDKGWVGLFQHMTDKIFPVTEISNAMHGTYSWCEHVTTVTTATVGVWSIVDDLSELYYVNK